MRGRRKDSVDLVVPANAGTHNHRWVCLRKLGPLPSPTISIGGYGSRLKAGTTSLMRSRSTPHRRDRVGDRDGAFGHLGVQSLHHLTVELDRAARSVFGALERGDDLAGVRDFLCRRGEDRIAGHDLAWMDQRLAIKTEIARLRAFQRKAIDIAEIAVGSVKDFETVRPGCENAMR